MGFRFTKIDSTYEERIRINARRVRVGWGVWLAQFPWEHMLTLTTDPVRFSHCSEQRLNREVFRFCGELAYLSRRPVGWAYAVEGGGGASLHAHVLTMNTTSAARHAVLIGWQARSGITHRRDVDDTREAARYLCKCIGPNGEIVISDSLSTYGRSGDFRIWSAFAPKPIQAPARVVGSFEIPRSKPLDSDGSGKATTEA